MVNRGLQKSFSFLFALLLVFVSFTPSEAAVNDWTDFRSGTTTDPNKAWTVTFSQEVDPATVSDRNVRVEDTAGVEVAVEPKVGGETITVKPLSSYKIGQTYYLYIGPGIHSVSGIEQKANVKFKFTVEREVAAPDQQGTIQSIGSQGILLNGKTYTASPALQGLLGAGNDEALRDAKVSFTSDGTMITGLTELRLANGGTEGAPSVLDGGKAILAGSVFVEDDFYEIRNLTVQGDLTITGKVKEGFTAERLHVEGTVHVDGDEELAASARTVMATANPYTKMKIVFHDSTVAEIIIGKEDSYFEGSGSTKVTFMALKANADIHFNPEVILPYVEISKGVTRVDLNATIKDVIIESNDDIQITGSGDFEKVTVNTDKTVSFDAKGTIGNLKTTNAAGTVTLGEQVAISNVEVPAGKTVNDVITNFEDKKDKIEKIGGKANPDFDSNEPPIGEPGDHFAAGVTQLKDRFGYVKLNVKNPGNHRVMYEQAAAYTPTPRPQIGDLVPAQAVEYRPNVEFPLYWSHDIYVYLVDQNNRIVEMKKVSDLNVIFPRYKFDGKKLTVTTLLKSPELIEQQPHFNSLLYIVDSNFAQMVPNLKDKQWGQVDGLHTVTIPLNQPFSGNGFVISHYPSIGFYGTEGNVKNEALAIKLLKFILEQEDQIKRNDLDWALRSITCGRYNENESVDERCTDHKVKLFESNSVSMKAYKEEFLKNEASIQSVNDVRQIIAKVDNRLRPKVDVYKKAAALVEGLFKEDRHDYPYEEQLRNGITEQDIDKALTAVQQVSDEFDEKQRLLSDVEGARWLLRK